MLSARRHLINRTIVLAPAILAGATSYAADEHPSSVALKDADGKDVGTAKISAKGAGVRIALDLKGLAPGENAVHIHQTAKCEGPKIHHRRWPFQSGYEETRS